MECKFKNFCSYKNNCGNGDIPDCLTCKFNCTRDYNNKCENCRGNKEVNSENCYYIKMRGASDDITKLPSMQKIITINKLVEERTNPPIDNGEERKCDIKCAINNKCFHEISESNYIPNCSDCINLGSDFCDICKALVKEKTICFYEKEKER